MQFVLAIFFLCAPFVVAWFMQVAVRKRYQAMRSALRGVAPSFDGAQLHAPRWSLLQQADRLRLSGTLSGLPARVEVVQRGQKLLMECTVEVFGPTPLIKVRPWRYGRQVRGGLASSIR